MMLMMMIMEKEWDKSTCTTPLDRTNKWRLPVPARALNCYNPYSIDSSNRCGYNNNRHCRRRPHGPRRYHHHPGRSIVPRYTRRSKFWSGRTDRWPNVTFESVITWYCIPCNDDATTTWIPPNVTHLTTRTITRMMIPKHQYGTSSINPKFGRHR